VAIEELVRLGVLTLHQDYSTGHHARRYSVWYRFGSGALPASLDPPRKDLPDARLLAERRVSEGVLRVLAPGDGTCQVELRSGPADPRTPAESAARKRRATPKPHTDATGRAWWRRMYAARAFTVAEALTADPARAIPGPWTWRRVAPARKPPSAIAQRSSRALLPPSGAGPPRSGESSSYT
jgi:hypothetical protein